MIPTHLASAPPSCTLDSSHPGSWRSAVRAVTALSVAIVVAGLGCTGPADSNTPAFSNPERAVVPTSPAAPARTAAASGSDWPTFLGPTQDNVSTEKGIIAP